MNPDIETFAIMQAKQFIREGRQLLPVLFLETRDNRIEIIGFPDISDKDWFASKLKQILETGKYKSYMFINEAFYVSRIKTLNDEDLTPSKCKDRKEAILLTKQNDTGESILNLYPFERNGEEIVFMEKTTGEEFDGRFKFWK